MTTCKGIKKNGENCTKKTKNNSGFCHLHLDQKESLESTPSKECPICYESLSDGEILECGHSVHLTCIEKSMKAECPICRKPLQLNENILKCIENNAQEMKDEWDREENQELQHQELQHQEFQHDMQLIAHNFLLFSHVLEDIMNGNANIEIDDDIDDSQDMVITITINE